jgi:hypothetical protein
VTGTHAVWVTSELVHATRESIVQRFDHRIYRQALEEPDAVFIHALRGQRGCPAATVMADGTVVLAVLGLSWHRPGRTHVFHGRPLPLIALYPDGVLVHDPTGVQDDVRSADGVVFLPFRGLSLDVGGKVQVVPRGVKRFWHGEPVRHGARFAWIRDSNLEVFRLNDRRQVVTPLHYELHRTHYVSLYDGETVFSSWLAFDATTGRLLFEQESPERPRNLLKVFAIRHRVGYYQDDGQLMAVDLTSPTGASIALRPAAGPAWPKPPPNRRWERPFGVLPFAETESGLIVWDAGRWVTVAWLKDWRDAEKGRTNTQGR